MEADLRISGSGAADQYPLLWEWLSGEPRLSGQVAWASGPPGETALGAEAWIAVALGSGGAATVLAGSLGRWLSRPARPGLTLKITSRRTGSQETRTVELEVGRVNSGTHRVLVELLGSSGLDTAGDTPADTSATADEHGG